MPELPEVETIVRELRRRVVGRVLGRAEVVRSDIVRKAPPGGLAPALRDRRVLTVDRRAKRILVQLDPPGTLVVHLGMTGRLTLQHVSDAVETHTHLRLPMGGGVASNGEGPIELRFRDPRRFGGVWFFDSSEEIVGDRLAEVGEEPLSLTPKRFRGLLNRSRQIKALLLDQAVIAGLGNIYTDEALFAAGIHPLTCADRLDEDSRNRLLTHIKRILRRAIRHRGTTLMDYRTAGGDEGSFQRLHRVYHREGQPCGRCGGVIVRIQVAGRSSFLCPTCQRPLIGRRRALADQR